MKVMKTFIKNILLLTVVFIASVGVFSSCSDDDDNGSTPVIRYVRSINAAASDSIITKAYLGAAIAIIGDNLSGVKEIWFNDQKAKINPVYITNNSILVSIPNDIPSEVTDKIRLVTGSGVETLFDFGVNVPTPVLNSMSCEYAKIGSPATINGFYFLPVEDKDEPVVMFTPNIEAKIESYSQTAIRVIIPDGAKEGPISIRSRYGATSSSFYYLDSRGMILDWDNLNATGGWRSGNISDSDPISGISGKYVRFKGKMSGKAGDTWNEDAFSFNLWGTANGRPKGNLFSTDPETSVLKFEVNVLSNWSAGALQMIFTPWSLSGVNGYISDGVTPRGLWMPWKDTGSFVTDGWITVNIPLKNFKYSHDGSTLTSVPGPNDYGGLTFFVYNGGIDGTDCEPDILIDNIRVVPE